MTIIGTKFICVDPFMTFCLVAIEAILKFSDAIICAFPVSLVCRLSRPDLPSRLGQS